ncbi:capsule assembly Wzi family protein [Shewanella litorisediminis]|uniref:Capsule assembly Wzi family protein n=1 Tax=Shewanella litorisediminis TaxID=1173586 RepID=A0ABX7FZP6_9GAMM|nr:capsule assembly Wzi family protein [Shewanella litorisediminis]MCL2919617.1 capsule assembly Wzi family protein [Shewanella litorisediminis]QRH00509.1 capsule assembly Wzi family protein [Shewanella litorisediminis]
MTHTTHTVRLLALLSSTLPFFAQADWWISPDDLALRADIQRLADTEIIGAPVLTYPLMWSAIEKDVQAADPASLSRATRDALFRVQAALAKAKPSVITDVKLGLANDERRFRGFGDAQHDKISTTASLQAQNNWGIVQLSGSWYDSNLEGNQARLDNSFGALRLGNWVLAAGSIPKYWGPGWDTGLIQTTNARPMPGISLTRDNAAAFDLPVLEWLGHWTFTTAFSQMESERHVPDARHWGARGSFKPLTNLEIGASWTMQWGGKGYGNSLKDWWDGLFNGGKSESEVENGQENMLAGYDFRYSTSLFGAPVALYYERIHEDFHHGKKRLINASNLGGVDLYLDGLNTLVFLEYSDTKAACGVSSNHYNCLYEHGFYRSGYRYYGRSLGSTYDNDTEALVLGAVTHLSGGDKFISKARWLRLNVDGSDALPPGGNPQSPGRYEQVYQLEAQYRMPFQGGELLLEASLAYSDFRYVGGNDWSPFATIRYEKRF